MARFAKRPRGPVARFSRPGGSLHAVAAASGASPRRGPHRRGGVCGWLLGGVAVLAALAVLAWMLLLPGVVESRLAAVTGAQFRVQGLMGDPFAGRATARGWVLHAADDPASPVLARGGRSEIVVADWRAAMEAAGGESAGSAPASLEVDRLDLTILEANLAPDTKGAWPLLALAASAGLPYERGGKVGDAAPIKVKLLRLRVETVTVRDAATGRETPVRIDWRGEFRDVDHAKPIVAELLAAAAKGAPAADSAASR